MNKPNPHDRDLNKELKDREDEKEKLEIIANQLRNDRIHLMKQPEYRRVLANILNKARIHNSTFTGNAHGNFHEGKRSLGLEILQDHQEAVGSDVYDLFKLTFGEISND